MAYVRVTSVIFSDHDAAEGAKILQELNDEADKHEGHILGMVLRSVVNPNHFLRISMWHDRHQADHASTTDHVVALRARLNVLTVDGHHREDSFEYVGDVTKLRLNL
jgi:quinol monooxygenase YgiN